jgi:methyl acetate hydrolase
VILIFDANYRFELTPEMRDRLAGAHFRWPDGSVTVRGKILSDDVKNHVGGLGAYSTAQDFAQVLLIMVNDGKHRK